MTSTLACIGMVVPDEAALDALLTRVLDDSQIVGRPGAVETRRWVDESGVVLTVVRQGESVVDLLPSFAAPVSTQLAEVAARGGYVAADVMEHGALVTRIACAVPQSPYLPRIPIDNVAAAITALGVDVTIHADAAAFDASPASLLGTSADGEEPARFAAESLLPYGLFAEHDGTDPVAFVAGVVEASETRTNTLTGQVFHAALLRTVGFTAAICLAADDHPQAPQPGNVIAGSCYLVADIASLWKDQPKPRRSWLRKRPGA